MSPVAVPLHPEAVPGQPQTVRWVVPAGLTPFVGEAGGAPGELGGLLTEGTLEAVRCEPVAVVTTLAEGESWRDHGDEVRRAVASALGTAGWVPKGATRTADEVLLELGRELRRRYPPLVAVRQVDP